jgi:hypothetical protein
MNIRPSDVRYLKIDVGPRYWEDSKVNGQDDISWEEQNKGVKPNMPFATYFDETASKRKSDSYRWVLTIDLLTMKIIDWPNGVEARVFYKVCDDGAYYLLDENKNILIEKYCYVPSILCYIENGYGDYIDMVIDKDGNLYGFPIEEKDALLQKLIDTESFY